MFDELLPNLLSRDHTYFGEAEEQVAALERAAAMSSRRDRKAALGATALWRAADESLGPEMTETVTKFMDEWRQPAFGLYR